MTTDQEFIDSIELSTSGVKAVTIRFDKWRMTLQNILGINTKNQMFYVHSEKRTFDANRTCSICHNHISNIDDSAVDHIQQYWTVDKLFLKMRLTSLL